MHWAGRDHQARHYTLARGPWHGSIVHRLLSILEAFLRLVNAPFKRYHILCTHCYCATHSMSDRLKSNLAVGLLKLLGRLSLVGQHRIANLLILLMLVLKGQSYQHTKINIDRCFPELTSQQKLQLIKESLRHTLYAALEMGSNWTQPSQKSLSAVVSVEGKQCLDQAHAQGGVVLLTPHLGNWELFANWAANHYPVTALYKPAKLTGLDELIHKARSDAGMQLAPATAKGVMKLKRALIKGEVNLILPDQEPPPSAGIISQWFNHPAYTMTLANQLANTKNSRIVLGFARRLDNSQGFAIELEDITQQCRCETIEESVAALNAAVESLVRRAPEQYQWEYRRFKHTLEQG